jgi:hypothetical protein
MAKRRKKRVVKRRKAGKKRRSGISRIERAIEKVMSKHYTIALDGSRHKVSFPGHAHHKKTKKKRGSGYLRSAENLRNLARGRAIRKAKLAGSIHYRPSRGFIGPIESSPAKAIRTHAKRMAALAKARAVRARNLAARHAGFGI